MFTRRFILAFLASDLSRQQQADTALDRYVRKPDSSYQYTHTGSIGCNGCKAELLDLTSQTWRKPEEVDRTVWKHWLTVIRPEKTASSVGLLFISGGSIGSRPPAQPDPMLQMFAKEAGIVVAELRMIPNEPVKFNGEQKTQGVPARRRRRVAAPPADDQSRRARHGRSDCVLEDARGRRTRGGPFYRQRSFQARLDHLDHGRGRQARDRHRSARHRYAESREVIHSSSARVWLLGSYWRLHRDEDLWTGSAPSR
ncbi:MAG: PhoPQ-activated protein PqaA family protein [Bryobacteraceae bacterium]